MADIVEHAELLGQLPLFRGLDRVSLAKLAGHLEAVRVSAGQALFLQGDQADALYLISRGTFGIFARATDSSDQVLLNILRRGEAVGEMALLTSETRNATVRAEEDSEVLRLPSTRFLELVRGDPSVGLAITATLSRRLRATDAARVGAPGAALASPPTLADGAAESADGRGPTRAAAARRRTIGLLLGLVLLVGGWFGVPPPGDLGAPGWHVLVSLIGVVPILALESLPDGAIALLLVALWAAAGLVPVRVALSGYSTTTWVLTVAIFTIGAAIASSGLLYRLALWAVTRASSWRAQVLTLGLSGLLLGPAVPNATGRMSLVAGAVGELSDVLGYEPGSEAAAGLAMAALVGYGQMVAPFLTSSSITLLAFALLPQSARANLTWANWALRAAPLHVVLIVGLLATVLWLGRGHAPNRPTKRLQRALRLQRMLLGRLSRMEIMLGLIVVALLVGFATQSLHGMDPAWVAVGGFVLMAAIGAMTLETISSVNWSTVLLLGMLAGVGDVFNAARLDTWLANIVIGSVGGLVNIRLAFVLAVGVLCLALSLVLRWQAAVPIVIVALSPVASGAGIDPWVVAIVTLTASNTFFLPYQSTIYMALFAGTRGRLFRHAQLRVLSIAYAALVLAGLAVSVPYWQALGLL